MSGSESGQIVYLVDDDEALRDSLAWMLEGNAYPVVQFDSGEALLSRFAADWRGCLVLDVRMPGMSGLELFDELKRRHCTLPVIFITGHGDVPMAVSAVKKGALDFIEKPFADTDFLRLIEHSMVLEAREREQRQRETAIAARLARLTRREHEVLQLIIAGKLNKQIADQLGISIKTVELHRAQVMSKMAAGSLAELVQQVVQPGLVPVTGKSQH